LLLTAIAILALGLVFVTLPSLRGDSTSPPAEVELVTLRPAGFEPSEITRPKGPFVLFVDDRSDKDSSSLELKRMNGQRVRDVSLNRRKSEWNEVVDLAPGTYALQDAINSEVRCQITILP
jgi:hypothetical protein